MTQHLKVRYEGAVQEIIFARPEKKHALSKAMYQAATAALNEAQKNPAVRVVRFGAEGDLYGAIFAERLTTAEAGEALRAFAERRQPDFLNVA